MSEEGKLSKNQLKKLAKKAEKAAKKGGNKETTTPTTAVVPDAKGSTNVVSNAAVAPPTPAPAPTPSAPENTFKLCHPDTSLSSLKVFWASQLNKITLEVAKSSDTKGIQDSFWSSSAGGNKPVLIYGSETIGGGGNSMAKAISFSGSELTTVQTIHQAQVDEWCEWERTVLRPTTSKNDEKKLDSALQHLSVSLDNAFSPFHILGQKDTIADVVIVATLTSTSTSTEKWPSTVLSYVKAHQAALDNAKEALEKYVEKSVTGSKPEEIDLTNPSLLQVLAIIFKNACKTIFEDGGEAIEQVFSKNVVSRCKDTKHGDYQCNVAMPIFGILKKVGALPAGIRSPKDVATALINSLTGGNDDISHSVLTQLSVQGSGFVVCRIQSGYLQTHVNQIIVSKELPKPRIIEQGKEPYVCVVDFSSPNIAKEMHVGHLRSTIIGESVCRILEYMGCEVNRVNHVGDWGTQFGMLIQYLKEEYPGVSSGSELPNITDLTVFYRNAKQRFDDDSVFKKTAQLNVVKLQSGDGECVKIWKLLCDISRKEFEKVYKRLDVNVTECGESFYNPKIPQVIEEFDKAGFVSVEDGGAKCVFVPKFSYPLMLQKSDGGFGYDSTDMAALKYRLQELKANRIIVITDYSQEDHFKMCNSAANQIGWVDKGQKLEHIGFGTVQGEDGKRFKTRSGDTVRLVDLLDESVARMETSLRSRIKDGKASITEEDVHDVAESIGYGAVKYFDLHRNPTSNYKFSYDSMLDTKGNTAVYLLYARVRFESIIAKAKKVHNIDIDDVLKENKISLDHPSERNLALQLMMFADTMILTLDKLYPYHICDYVYNLAIAASEFVTQCRVLGSPEMKSRLLLCHVTSQAMHQCFELLGIRNVKRI